ncbi:MAG: hypothetical protein KH366_21185 [Clostridiaceae bacterium]|nr:hypothetical protein [Clostridiaceae bacterium]
MKKIRLYLVLAVFTMMLALTACSNGNNGSANQSSQAGTESSESSSSGNSSSGNTESMTTEEGRTESSSSVDESTGVIDGLINDVENGVDDMVGGGTGTGPTNESTTGR